MATRAIQTPRASSATTAATMIHILLALWLGVLPEASLPRIDCTGTGIDIGSGSGAIVYLTRCRGVPFPRSGSVG